MTNAPPREMTPWQIHALLLVEEKGISEDQAIQCVILEWLARGDTRPFCDFVLSGGSPHQTVLEGIATMIMRGDPSRYDFPVRERESPVLARDLPFALTLKAPTRGKQIDIPNQVRDLILHKQVAAEIAAGSSYDAAIASVHASFCKLQKVSVKLVRNAYDNNLRKE